MGRRVRLMVCHTGEAGLLLLVGKWLHDAVVVVVFVATIVAP